MKRTLNRRLLLRTLGILLIAGVAIHSVHALQLRRNAGGLLTNADRAKEAGDVDQALAYYTYYLSYEPEDAAALAKYALALDQHANNPDDWLRVKYAFEQALRRDPTRKDLRFRLALDLIRLQQFKGAIANIEILLAPAPVALPREEIARGVKGLPQWDDKAELEHILGWCLEASGAYPRAAAAFARAIAHNPHRLQSYVLLAEVLQNRQGQPEAADKIMDDLVRENDQSFRAYLIRSHYRRASAAPLAQQRDLLAAAEADLDKALALAPNEPEVLLARADWAQSKGDIKKAREWMQKAWELEPGNVAVVKALAGLQMRAGTKAEAAAILTAALKDAPKAYELWVLLADLLIDEGKLADAATKIDELSEAGAPSAFADYLRGRLATLQGQWADALTLLQRARADLGTDWEWSGRVHALLGLCYQQQGDHEQELVAFRRAVFQEPSWTLARFGLGSALLANGLIEEAITELRPIQNAADAPPELWAVMARALVWRNLRRSPPPSSLSKEGARRAWNEVEQVLKRAQEKTPTALELPWLRAEVSAAQKDFRAAEELLEKARAARPEQLMYWAALADLAARQYQWSRASLLLDQAEKKLGDSPELRLAKCRLWAGEGSAAARQGLAALAQNLEPFTPGARARILRELADTWVRLGEPARAESLWQRLVQEQPTDLGSRFALFENALRASPSQEGQGGVDKARTLLADLRKLEGEPGKLWPFAAAALLVHEAANDPAKLDEARKILEQLARGNKTWARIPLLQARIEELEGNYDKALGHYLRAVELGDRQPRHVTRLVQLLELFKRYLDAEQILHDVEEQTALSPELARMGADVALANQDAEEALRLAMRAVSPTSRDYRDYVWLGRIYHGTGKDLQAEEVLRKAALLGPDAPDTWIALAEQLTRMGKREAALAITLEAKEKVSPRLASYTEARCFEAMGLVDLAEAIYRQALSDQADVDFVFLARAADFHQHAGQTAKAQSFLEALVKVDASAPAEYVVRARRQLASILAAKGGADYARALALVDENLHKHPSNAADIRARAFIQAVQPSQRRQAIRVFEETARRQPLSADEQLQLAQLFDADGAGASAREQLVALLTAQPENPQFLAYYIRLLIQGEEESQARDQLQKLERLEPGSQRTRELARILRK